MLSSTYLGLGPSAYGIASSASSSPVGIFEMLCRRSVTCAVLPAGTRGGLMIRLQLSRYRARRAAMRLKTGSPISATPTHSRLFSVSAIPARVAATPAARNEVPLVVSPDSHEPSTLSLLPQFPVRVRRTASGRAAAAAARSPTG